MSNPSRRAFVLCVVASGSAITATQATAQAATVSETDPTAAALGYKADHTKVDKAKYPKYDPSQTCSNCMLYQAKPTDASGPCTLFAGKLVAGQGWCSAWAKKP